MAVRSIRDLLVARLGVGVSVRLTKDLAVIPVAPQVILKQDPARIGFLIVNFGGFTGQLEPNFVAADPGGIRVDPSGGSLAANWEEDGEVVAYEWTARALGGVTDFWVLEVILDQGREVPAPAGGGA